LLLANAELILSKVKLPVHPESVEGWKLTVYWKELSMGKKTILILIALCGLSFSNDIPNTRWENPHSIFL
jgi:hypothetical protein